MLYPYVGQLSHADYSYARAGIFFQLLLRTNGTNKKEPQQPPKLYSCRHVKQSTRSTAHTDLSDESTVCRFTLDHARIKSSTYVKISVTGRSTFVMTRIGVFVLADKTTAAGAFVILRGFMIEKGAGRSCARVHDPEPSGQRLTQT